MKHWIQSAALAAALVATAAHAGPQSAAAVANGRVRIIKPMTVSAPAQMSFGKLQYNAGSGPATSPVVLSAAAPVTRTSPNVQLLPGGAETPAIRTITGQPGAVYRVGLPPTATASPGNLVVSAFKVWSANGGDISATRLGQLNSAGTDTIRVGATLTVPVKTKVDTFPANVPIAVSYE